MPGVLQSLCDAIEGVQPSPSIGTRTFADACSHLTPLLDELGSVFGFAKADFVDKRNDLLGCSGQFPTLDLLVAADKEAGTVATRGSHARNLDRLKNALKFLQLLFVNLLDDPDGSMHQCASKAYEESMAYSHTMPVRLAVKAGLLWLPSRAKFLQRIGETDASAAAAAAKFVRVATAVVQHVESLYDGPIPALA